MTLRAVVCLRTGFHPAPLSTKLPGPLWSPAAALFAAGSTNLVCATRGSLSLHDYMGCEHTP